MEGLEAEPLGRVCQRAAESAHEGIASLAQHPRASQRESRAALHLHLVNTRERLARLLVLARWLSSSGAGAASAARSLALRRSKCFALTDAASSAAHSVSECQSTRQSPLPDVETSLDVLGRGTFSRLPSSLSRELAPHLVHGLTRLTQSAVSSRLTSAVLSNLLQCELAHNQEVASVDNGTAVIRSPSLYSAMLTLSSASSLKCWCVSNVQLLVCEQPRHSDHENRPVTLTQTQAHALTTHLDAMLSSEHSKASAPLVRLHDCMQEVAAKVALERLAAQAFALMFTRWHRAINVFPLEGTPPPPGALVSYYSANSEGSAQMVMELSSSEPHHAIVRHRPRLRRPRREIADRNDSDAVRKLNDQENDEEDVEELPAAHFAALSFEHLLQSAMRVRAISVLHRIANSLENGERDLADVRLDEEKAQINIRLPAPRSPIRMEVEPSSGRCVLLGIRELIDNDGDVSMLQERARSCTDGSKAQLLQLLERLRTFSIVQVVNRAGSREGLIPGGVGSSLCGQSVLNRLSFKADGVLYFPRSCGELSVIVSVCEDGRGCKFFAAFNSEDGAEAQPLCGSEDTSPSHVGISPEGIEQFVRTTAQRLDCLAGMLAFEAELKRRAIVSKRLVLKDSFGLAFMMIGKTREVRAPARIHIRHSQNTSVAFIFSDSPLFREEASLHFGCSVRVSKSHMQLMVDFDPGSAKPGTVLDALQECF